MARITDEQIEAWIAVTAGATQEPWRLGVTEADVGKQQVVDSLAAGSGDVHSVFVKRADETLYVAVTGNGPTSEANAKHIGYASPTNVRALLEELKVLRSVTVGFHALPGERIVVPPPSGSGRKA